MHTKRTLRINPSAALEMNASNRVSAQRNPTFRKTFNKAKTRPSVRFKRFEEKKKVHKKTSAGGAGTCEG
jgi:hypothetical protein